MLSLLASAAHSQWTVNYLHPAGAGYSIATGVSGADQVGYALVGDYGHAARWTGSAASFVDMNPAGAITSSINDTDGVHQVGSFMRNPTIPPGFSINRAGVWSGTAASHVDLHPPGFPPANHQYSFARATQGTLQTGVFSLSEAAPECAVRRNLTAASYASIHPAGYGRSSGLGTDGTTIVGVAVPDINNPFVRHAGLWKFAPDMFIDLHPVGAFQSEAEDVDGAIQVGFAAFGGVGSATHAALWSGTSASFVDLNPPGAISSTLRGVDGGYQVGSADRRNAGIWTGTASSFVNLHSFLTPSAYSRFRGSERLDGRHHDQCRWNRLQHRAPRSEAILWTTTIPEPSSFSIIAVIFPACSIFVRMPRLRGVS